MCIVDILSLKLAVVMDTPDTEHTFRSVARRLLDRVGENFTKWQVVFISQVIIIYVVVISCIINLSINNGKNELWISLLGYSLGCMLPSPRIKRGDFTNG